MSLGQGLQIVSNRLLGRRLGLLSRQNRLLVGIRGGSSQLRHLRFDRCFAGICKRLFSLLESVRVLLSGLRVGVTVDRNLELHAARVRERRLDEQLAALGGDPATRRVEDNHSGRVRCRVCSLGN